MSENVYRYERFIIGYDKGIKDRSCLVIGELQNNNLRIIGEVFGESANVVNMIINNLQNQVQQKDNIISVLENEIISTQISEYGDTIEEAKKYLQKLEEGIKNETDK